jgi:hypothetical protein
MRRGAMRHFVNAFKRGVPIIALRTSTHAFSTPARNEFKDFTHEYQQKVIARIG